MGHTPDSLQALIGRLKDNGSHGMAAALGGVHDALADLGLAKGGAAQTDDIAKGDAVVVDVAGDAVTGTSQILVEDTGLKPDERPGFDDLGAIAASGADLVAKGGGEESDPDTEEAEGENGDDMAKGCGQDVAKAAAADDGPALDRVALEASDLLKGFTDMQAMLAASQEESALLKGKVDALQVDLQARMSDLTALVRGLAETQEAIAKGAQERELRVASAIEGIAKGVGEHYLLDRAAMADSAGVSGFPSGKGRTGRFDADTTERFSDQDLLKGVSQRILTDAEFSRYRGTGVGPAGSFSDDPARHESIVTRLRNLQVRGDT